MSGGTFRIRATTRLRNGYVMEAREKLGLNQTQAAEAIGVTANQLSRAELMKRVTMDVAVRIADYLGLTIDQVAPDFIKTWEGSSIVSVTADVQTDKLLEFSDRSRVRAIAMDPAEAASDVERDAAIEGVLLTLTLRERTIVRLRYGLPDENGERVQLHTTEIAERYGMTHQGIQVIIGKAHRKMEHPVRSKKLLPFVAGGE